MGKDEAKDVFEDAAKDHIKKATKLIEDEAVELYETEEVLDQSIETATTLTINNVGIHWSKLKEDLEGVHAERFNKELTALSGREFVRLYLKALEFSKPKVTRVEAKVSDAEIPIMRITIMKRDNKGKTTEIDITKED